MWDLSVAVTGWLGDARDELLVRRYERGSAAVGVIEFVVLMPVYVDRRHLV